jgi:hypothetical protein
MTRPLTPQAAVTLSWPKGFREPPRLRSRGCALVDRERFYCELRVRCQQGLDTFQSRYDSQERYSP